MGGLTEKLEGLLPSAWLFVTNAMFVHLRSRALQANKSLYMNPRHHFVYYVDMLVNISHVQRPPICSPLPMLVHRYCESYPALMESTLIRLVVSKVDLNAYLLDG